MQEELYHWADLNFPLFAVIFLWGL
jgi:hypothetical protein